MIKYITQAKRIINKESVLIKTNNEFYYRNRIIDCAARLYAEDSKNFYKLYPYYKKHVVECEIHARHHGVNVGDVIGWILAPKTKMYYSQLALVKKELKRVYKNS